MKDLELLYFERLKNAVQGKYLLNHSPSEEDISKWKGIDIIYFQEELRKAAKGNISEKTFYTYFKSKNSKLPRIDMLNILSIYAGYSSWSVFKKNNPIDANLKNPVEDTTFVVSDNNAADPIEENEAPIIEQIPVLQNNTTGNELVKEEDTGFPTNTNPYINLVKQYLWLGVSAILAFVLGLIVFKDDLLSKKYYYSFIDADRNSKINAALQVEILKEKESPIRYTAKPNEPFVYTTKSKSLVMVVSSPYYKTDTIRRNLETAPEAENIELKPNDYAIMLFYYSKSIKDLKKKRASLGYLISDNALIYQVFDSDQYGVETMDKQRYISFVTLPTTSLENLEVIETKNDKQGKINMIKFRIAHHDATK